MKIVSMAATPLSDNAQVLMSAIRLVLPTLIAALALSVVGCKRAPPQASEKSCGSSAAAFTACVEDTMRAAQNYELELEYQVQHSFPAGAHGASGSGPTTVVLSRSETTVRHRTPLELEVRAVVTEEPLYEGSPSQSRQHVLATQKLMQGSVTLLGADGSVASEDHVVVDRERLAPKDRPFDAGLALPGTGFIPGFEFLGSTRYIVERYTPLGTPRAVDLDGERLLVLAFQREPLEFLNELFERQHEMVAQLVVAQTLVDADGEQMQPEFESMLRRTTSAMRSLRSVQIWISAQDFAPRRIELGAEPEHPTHILRVKRWETRPVFGPGTFTKTSSEARDLTEDLLGARKAYQQAFAEHPEVVGRVRAQLLAALKEAPPTKPPPVR